jgi:hypothetical protein
MQVTQVSLSTRTCNAEVLHEIGVEIATSDRPEKMYCALSDLDERRLRQIGEQVAYCADCSLDGGTTCPNGIAQTVDTVLTEKGLAWEVFGLWYLLAQSDKDYQ